MTKIIITGNKKYTKNLFEHLKKEHPSVRKRIKLQKRKGKTK